mmetsp:Transcript_7766/g.11142  ORF Transcript_7766/g.11142 Transcript_7766/m.11142 type:complete len:441 (+) Transcript_7766:99-1421(+)
MPQRLRPPSRTDTITFPVFGSSWWGSHEDGTSIVAFCGGGGSARTGVHNKIVVRINASEELEISTEFEVCIAVQVYQNPMTKSIWLMGAVGNKICRYDLPNCSTQSNLELDEKWGGCNCLNVNVMADRMVIGCENNAVALYSIASDDDHSSGGKDLFQLLWSLPTAHEKAVCAVNFAPRCDLVVSSAKDGTAKVWNAADGAALSTLTCDVQDPKVPPPKRKPQVLVRGCAFGDLDGKVLYTIASPRRGKAYLARWIQQPNRVYQCQERMEISPCPISSMSLSSDGGLMALGGVDGTITLMDMQSWKKLKSFPEVHDLPVTCIAARPFALPLRGEEDGVMMHAISASADSQLAMLTLQRRAPKKKNAKGGGGGSDINLTNIFFILMWAGSIFWTMYRIVLETIELCEDELEAMALGSIQQCFLHTVLWAPSNRPGILVPPH